MAAQPADEANRPLRSPHNRLSDEICGLLHWRTFPVAAGLAAQFPLFDLHLVLVAESFHFPLHQQR